MFKVPEKYRITGGNEIGPMYYSDSSFGNNGAFAILLKTKAGTRKFTLLASDGAAFEHVSVSLPDRCPTWGEMCKFKDMFWDDDDCVMQLHPPKSEYVNNHPYCLHLWRPIGQDIPQPNHELVGIK